MRLLALILTVTVTGPSVTSLVCDWACAAKQQIVASGSGCHEHSTDAATRTMARGHQCHEVSPAPKTVLTTTSQAIGVVAISDIPLVDGSFTSAASRPNPDFDSPPDSPPRLSIPLRI